MQSYFFLPLLVSIATTQTCFESADRYINGRCFKLINQQLSYQEARTWCHNHQTYLATVPDITTDTYLASYAKTSFNEDYGSFWIGATRYNTSSKWQWDDGTPFVWSHFETQNLNFASESIKNGKWNTYTADKRLNFVCSYDPNGSPGTTDPPHFTTTPEATSTEGTATPSDPSPSCTRKTNSTILIAYSNDSDDYDFNVLRNQIVFHNGNNFFYGYSTYAHVRFDVKVQEEIQYHSNILSFNVSMSAKSPDPSLGYGDDTTTTDVFDVLKKFLKNKKSTVCGSLVYILVKRYPDASSVSDLIYELQRNHVFVYIVVNNVPSGGLYTDSLFEVATKTNGFCIFNSGRNFWVSVSDATAVNYRPYQFISQNYVVSGSGRIELPVFKTPSVKTYSEQVLVVTTIQNHKIDTSFKSLNYTIASVDGSFVFTGPDSDTGYPRFGSAILAQPQLNGTVDYKWTIDYRFNNDQPQVIETRMYSNYYHDFLPLPAL